MINRKLHNMVRGTARPAAVVAAAIVLSLCVPFPAGAQGRFTGPGWHEITSLKPGKVLDLDGNDQRRILRSPSWGTDSQPWDIRGGFLRGNSTGAVRTRFSKGTTVNFTLPKHSRDAEGQAGLMGTHMPIDAAYDTPTMDTFLGKIEDGNSAAFSTDHANRAGLVFDKWNVHTMTPPMHNARPFPQPQNPRSRAPVSNRCLQQAIPQRWPMAHLRQNLLQFQSSVRAQCFFFGSIDQ